MIQRTINFMLWVALIMLALVFFTCPARGQVCGQPTTQLKTMLLPNSGTLPGSADMSAQNGYLYVLTQWGFARAPLGNFSNPAPYGQIVIGREGGSTVGIIPILCDCHAGGTTMSVCSSDSAARMISDWGPASTGNDSGLQAQLAQATGTITMGQQIKLASVVPPGASLASINIAAKFFGYLPTKNNGVMLADLTSPTGSANPPPITATPAIGWLGSVKLDAAELTTSGYSAWLLMGATPDLKLRIAQISPGTGIPVEMAVMTLIQGSAQIDAAVYGDRIFIFSAGNGALDIYEFIPPATIKAAGSIPGRFLRLAARPPALFAHRQATNKSYIDVYDMAWLTQGGAPFLAGSFLQAGAPPPAYLGNGFEAVVSGSTGYLYREQVSSPNNSITTDTMNLSCLSGQATQTPTVTPTQSVIPRFTLTSTPAISGRPTCPPTPTPICVSRQ